VGPIGTRQNPFRSVQTRLNLSKHVQTCWNTFKPVETRSDLLKQHVSRPPPLPLHPPSPSSPSPFSPFFWGGRGGGRVGGGGGGGALPRPPGGGGDEVPPLRILTTKKKLFSLSLSSLCVIYPRGFSQSTAQNYINLWCPLNKIHCGILQKINIIFIIYPPSINIIKISLKKISSLCGRWSMM